MEKWTPSRDGGGLLSVCDALHAHLHTQQQLQQRLISAAVCSFRLSAAFSRTGGWRAAGPRWINFKYATAAVLRRSVEHHVYPCRRGLGPPPLSNPSFLVVHTRTHTVEQANRLSCKLAYVRSTQGLNFRRKEPPPQGSAPSSSSQYANVPVGVVFSRVSCLRRSSQLTTWWLPFYSPSP